MNTNQELARIVYDLVDVLRVQNKMLEEAVTDFAQLRSHHHEDLVIGLTASRLSELAMRAESLLGEGQPKSYTHG